MIKLEDTMKKYSGTGRAELLVIINKYENGIILTGWKCDACNAFNSDEKDMLLNCRSCNNSRW